MAAGVVSRTSVSDCSSSEDEGVVALPDNPPPSFGNISVVNSNEVHFGNKTFYHGPVTIKQIVYSKENPARDEDDEGIVLDASSVTNGLENPVFIPDFPQDKQSAADEHVTQDGAGTEKGFHQLQKFVQKNLKNLVLFIIFVIATVLLLSIVLLSAPFSKPKESTTDNEQDSNTPVETPLDPSTNVTLPGKLKLVSRLEWLAQPPIEPANKLKVPVPYVIIHHTATENCSSQAQCRFHVRYIQTFHIESRSWWDIGYNFLVGGDGEAYEGRGWTSEGAHTFGFNDKSIGIAFIGTFIAVLPPKHQIVTCKRLIAKGVELGYIRKDYKLLAARQLQTTQSPGQALYEELKTWEHWSSSL